MPSPHNGSSQNRIAHLLRDDAGTSAQTLGNMRSGRGFVVALVFVLCTLALSLFVAFRQWKSQHLELADYGARRVAPLVAGWNETVPTGVSPEQWRRIVAQCEKLVVALTGSGVLDLEQMRRLRAEIQTRIDQTSSRNAASQLALFWGDLEAQAGPALTGFPRFDLASTVRFLTRERPPGPDDEPWSLAVLDTRAMLVELGHDTTLSKDKRLALRDALAARLEQSNRDRAAADLAAVWEIAAATHQLPEGYTSGPSGERNESLGSGSRAPK